MKKLMFLLTVVLVIGCAPVVPQESATPLAESTSTKGFASVVTVFDFDYIEFTETTHCVAYAGNDDYIIAHCLNSYFEVIRMNIGGSWDTCSRIDRFDFPLIDGASINIKIVVTEGFTQYVVNGEEIDLISTEMRHCGDTNL